MGKGKRPKIAVSKAELRQRLQTCLKRLHYSCEAYDRGDSSEAEQVALQLRILLHDTKMSKSLLNQLDLKGSFWDTSYKVPPVLILKDESTPDEGYRLFFLGSRLIPVFDKSLDSPKKVPFDQWWEGEVLLDKDGVAFTRRQLVLTVADADGGAHIDPELDESYYKLTREENQRFVMFDIPDGDFTKRQPAPELFKTVAVSVRQIGHEVLKSLYTVYNYDGRKYYPGPAMIGMTFKGEIIKVDKDQLPK